MSRGPSPLLLLWLSLPLIPGGPSCSHNRSTTCGFLWSLNTPLAIVLHALSYAWESSWVSYVHRLNSVSWHLVISVHAFLLQFSYNPFHSLYPERLLISQVTKYGFPCISVHQAAANTVSWKPIELKVLYHLHSLWTEKYILSLWALFFTALGNSYKSPSQMAMWQPLS